MVDLTQGNTLRAVIWFAVPMFLGNILQEIYSVVDTMVVGYNLGDQSIAAIGATVPFFDLLITFAVGLNNGFGIVVSKYFGRKDRERLRCSIAVMVMLNVISAIIITLSGSLGMDMILKLMNVPLEIRSEAGNYIIVIVAGMTATMAYNMVGAILRAVGNSSVPLCFVGVSFVCNIGLDLLFVIVFSWGIMGAAVATVISQVLASAGCGIYIYRNYKEILPERRHFAASGELIGEMAATGYSMAFMLSVLCIGSMILQSAINKMGEVVIAAHMAARKLVNLFMQPLISVATANATFASQNWGAGKNGRITKTLRKVIGLEIAWSLCAMLFVQIAGRLVIKMMTNSEDQQLIHYAVINLRINFSFYFILGVLLCLRTTMQAVGERVTPVIISCIELLIKIVGAFWLVPLLGYTGACFVEPVTWLLCTILLVVFYWLKTRKKLETI